jgi:hypothetical protein
MWSDFGHTDYLFAMNNNGTAGFQSKARIYWCVVREDEVAMRDFVPVKRRSDNKPGMLDRVAGKLRQLGERRAHGRPRPCLGARRRRLDGRGEQRRNLRRRQLELH